ncbi:MAG: propanediol utilization microcompartment protein PduB [Clostridia bacterium]|nr:propanediol utilization microcompartment protein PduB [Clostridia bacterium]
MNHSVFASDIAEFVGTAVLDTIGLTISNIDESLRKQMSLGKEIRCLGLISSRTGAAGQIVACDNAIKATDTRIISIDLPRDTKGWGGHGCYIVMGGQSPEDVRHAVTLALSEIEKNASEVYISDAGHLEFAFSSGAFSALNTAFDAPLGSAFGFLAASPAAIGLVLADRACKSASIDIVRYMTPSMGTSHSNEVILAFSGSVSSVQTALREAKMCGISLLRAMGSEPLSPGKTPYI